MASASEVSTRCAPRQRSGPPCAHSPRSRRPSVRATPRSLSRSPSCATSRSAHASSPAPRERTTSVPRTPRRTEAGARSRSRRRGRGDAHTPRGLTWPAELVRLLHSSSFLPLLVASTPGESRDARRGSTLLLPATSTTAPADGRLVLQLLKQVAQLVSVQDAGSGGGGLVSASCNARLNGGAQASNADVGHERASFATNGGAAVASGAEAAQGGPSGSFADRTAIPRAPAEVSPGRSLLVVGGGVSLPAVVAVRRRRSGPAVQRDSDDAVGTTGNALSAPDAVSLAAASIRATKDKLLEKLSQLHQLLFVGDKSCGGCGRASGVRGQVAIQRQPVQVASSGLCGLREGLMALVLRRSSDAFPILVGVARVELVLADAQLTALVLSLLFNLLRAIPAETRRRVGRQCVRLGLHTICSSVLHRYDCAGMTVGHDGNALSASIEAASCTTGRDVCRCYEAAGLLLALLTCVQSTIGTEVLLGQDLQRLLHGALQLTSRLQSRFANYRTMSDFDCTLDTRRMGGGVGQSTSDGALTSPWSSSLLLASVACDDNRARVLTALRRLHESTADCSGALYHLCIALFTLSKPFLHSRTLGAKAVQLCTHLMELLTPFLHTLAPKLATVIAASDNGTPHVSSDASLHQVFARGQSNSQSIGNASSAPGEMTTPSCPAVVTTVVAGGAASGDEQAMLPTNPDGFGVVLTRTTPLWGGGVLVPHWLAVWWHELEMLEVHAVVLLRRLAGAVVGGAGGEEQKHSPVSTTAAARGVGELSNKEREAFLQTLPWLMRLTAGVDPPRHAERVRSDAAAPPPQWTHHVELVYTALMTMQCIFAMDRPRSLALLQPLGGLKMLVQRVLGLPTMAAERWHEFYLALCSLYALHRLPASVHIADPHCLNQRAPLPHVKDNDVRLGATMSADAVVPTAVTDDDADGVEQCLSAEGAVTSRDVATSDAEVACEFDPAQFAPELHDAVVAAGTAFPSFDAIALPWPFTDVPPPPLLLSDTADNVVTVCAADDGSGRDVDDMTPLRPPTAEQRTRVMRHCIRRLAWLDEMRSDDAGGATRHAYNVVYERDAGGTKRDTDAVQPRTAEETMAHDGLRFHADFESGNLQRAIAAGEREYDLVLAWDTCTNSFVQWFFFAVTNYAAGETYRFNILNMEKPGSTFNEGQCPLMLHVRPPKPPSSPSPPQQASPQPSWRRVGATGEDDGTMYFANPYRRPPRQARHTPTQPSASPTAASLATTPAPAATPRRQYYYTLSFAVTMPPQPGGRVFLANCFPYRYTDLLHDLQRLSKGTTIIDGDQHETDAGRPWVWVQSLCTSPAGLPVPIVTVTNPPPPTATRGLLLARRPVCVLVARVHPGESNASWMMRGILGCLLGNSPHCDRGVVYDLLDHFVFKVVPMLNVDGVVMGNHRCSLFGVDLNRDYLQPSAVLNPVIDALTRLVRHMIDVEQRRVSFFGDFHGHSRARNVPLYGETRTLVLPPTTPPASRVGPAGASPRPPMSRGGNSSGGGSVVIGGPLGDGNAADGNASSNVDAPSSERRLHVAPEKLLPCVMAARFAFADVAQAFYAVPRYKRGTSRAVMYQVCGIRMSYTIEGSMMGGFTATRACETHYNTYHYGRIGVSVLLALHTLLRAEAEASVAVASVANVSRVSCEVEGVSEGLPGLREEKTGGEAVMERAWQLFGSHGIVDTAHHASSVGAAAVAATTGPGIASGRTRRSQSVQSRKGSVTVVRGVSPSHSVRPAIRPQPPSHSPRPPLAGTAAGGYAMARRQERRGPSLTPPSTFAAAVAALAAGGAAGYNSDVIGSVEAVVASPAATGDGSGGSYRRGGVGGRTVAATLPPLPPFITLTAAQRLAVLTCLLRDRPVTRRPCGAPQDGTADAPEDNASDDGVADSVEVDGTEDSISEDDAEMSRTCSFSEQMLESMTNGNEDDDTPSM